MNMQRKIKQNGESREHARNPFRRAWGKLTDWDKSPVLAGIARRHVEKGRFDEAVMMGSIAVPALMDKRLDNNPEIRKRAAEALVKIGKDAIPRFAEKMQHLGNNDCWELVAWVISGIDRDAVLGLVEELNKELKNSPKMLKYIPTGVLMRIGENAIPVLVKVLEDEEAEVQQYAAEILERMARNGVDCSSAVPALADALRNWDCNSRQRAASALFAIGPENIEDKVLCLLILGRTNDIAAIGWNAIPALEKFLSTHMYYAAEALGKIGPKWMESDENRVLCLLVLGKAEDIVEMGKDAVPVLERLLGQYQRYEKIRGYGAMALGKIAEKGKDCSSAVPELINSLMYPADWETPCKYGGCWSQQEAARALGKIGGPSAICALKKVVENKDGRLCLAVRGRAAEALANITGGYVAWTYNGGAGSSSVASDIDTGTEALLSLLEKE